ncbi:MAG: glycosyltransferase [Nitrospirae bacterium]|nr:glycosyltransferase [Nitrospirota bacterium]
MINIKLSICIPLYNFGAFIGDTLSSILPQATDEVEIVVVDGASTDNTSEVISSFQRTFPRLRYHRLDKKGGIDRDMAKAVELAIGEYCWLFGGDDIMMPGAIANVLNEIKHGYDLFLCESILCGKDMHPIRKHNIFSISSERLFDLKDINDRKDYFSTALNTAAFFSFCSSLVFKRSCWTAIELDERFVGSHWAHVARFFRMIPAGLLVKYIPEPQLYKRGENDSFLGQGMVNRYRITIEGYDKLANTFFGKQSIEASHIRRTIKAEHNLKSILDAKLICHQSGLLADLKVLDQLVSTLYFDPIMSNRASLFVYQYTPIFVLSIAKPIYSFIQSYLLGAK